MTSCGFDVWTGTGTREDAGCTECKCCEARGCGQSKRSVVPPEDGSLPGGRGSPGETVIKKSKIGSALFEIRQNLNTCSIQLTIGPVRLFTTVLSVFVIKFSQQTEAVPQEDRCRRHGRDLVGRCAFARPDGRSDKASAADGGIKWAFHRIRPTGHSVSEAPPTQAEVKLVMNEANMARAPAATRKGQK
ncbi:unnamed protein product [Protopolystoma xenopodis]|uniref:Uncharacterized protein n=1 Tax=Protopolystoma xenopodis TaxID=117903 RepID=A0A3S5A4T0_9PLAT|nr:unnamed protein product [Protopolystoma xenopodis]